MQINTIIEKLRRRLVLIKSNRDPALFQAMRNHVADDRTRNRSVIVNFSDAERKHGCRFTCDFCSWRSRAEYLGDIYPTEQGLDQLLTGFMGSIVTISGGGDPLYDLENNLGRLMKLVRSIHRRGFLVEVVTMEWDAVREYCGNLLAEVDMWSLSAQGRSVKLATAIEEVTQSGGLARVSRVCTPGQNLELKRWADFYREAGAYQAILREDANHVGGMSTHEREIVRRTVSHDVRWLLNSTCSNNFFLVGDAIEHGDAALGAFRMAVE